MLSKIIIALACGAAVIFVAATSPPIAAHAGVALVVAAAEPDSGKTGDGESAFNNACRTCHSSKPSDNRLGPSLSGVVGRKAGQEPGFAYSPSLKNSGITWDAKTLDTFITNPDSVVPGSNMKPYTGISDAVVRAEIIAFLGGK